MEAVVGNALPYLEALVSIDWTTIKERLDNLPEKSKTAMTLTLSKGWFFGWHDGLNSLMELVEKIASIQPTEVDGVMAEYYRANLQPFADELACKYPDRADPIIAAVKAHLSLGCHGYFLSIPVFIAQADGLCTEIIGEKSALTKFGRGDKEFLSVLRDKHAKDPELLDLLCPLLELSSSDFMKSAAARKTAMQTSGESFPALNRPVAKICP